MDARLELVLAEAWSLLPSIKSEAWLTSVSVADLGSKHGSYNPDDGSLVLSTRLFTGKDAWELMYIDRDGNSPPVHEDYVSRALATAIHELLHAIGAGTGMDRDPVWLALSGFEETWEDRQSTGRYFERRPGWGDQEGSEWRFHKGTWFPRPYSSKSPFECLADCGTHIALGWDRGVTHPNGKSKLRWVRRHIWGETEQGRLDAVTSRWRTKWQATLLGER
jgi:hypothetical protein